MAVGVIYRVVQLGVVENEKWVTKGDSMFVKKVPIVAERGDILSDDGGLLATEIQFFDIYMDFKARGITEHAWKNGVDSLALLMSRKMNMGKNYKEMKNWLIEKRNADKYNRYVSLQKNVSYDELEEIRSFPIFRLGRNQGGLIIERHAKRRKPYGELASRTIGLSRENADHVGLELTYDDVLSGKQGVRWMYRTTRTYLPLENVRDIEPQRGNDIISTINVNIQDIAESSLKKSLKYHDAEYGVALVMEVKTG